MKTRLDPAALPAQEFAREALLFSRFGEAHGDDPQEWQEQTLRQFKQCIRSCRRAFNRRPVTS